MIGYECGRSVPTYIGQYSLRYCIRYPKDVSKYDFFPNVPVSVPAGIFVLGKMVIVGLLKLD